MSKKALSPELQDQLDKLATLPDEQIDTADIPEASPEAWLHARRPGLYRPSPDPRVRNYYTKSFDEGLADPTIIETLAGCNRAIEKSRIKAQARQ